MRFFLVTLVLIFQGGCAGSQETPETSAPEVDSPVILSELVYEEASFPSAHASTIEETPAGLAAAWFGGTDEGEDDVGIWFARHDGSGWSAPVEVANGLQSDGSRHPSWNPVLFQPEGGPLVLFYKIGPSPREWWGMVRISTDGGATWSDETRLPEGILGPIRAKPVMMADGSLLAGSSTEHDGWVVHMERYTKPEGDADMWSLDRLASAEAWEKVGPLNSADEFEAIQPTILVHSDAEVQILCRSRQKVITTASSNDGGRTWGAMTATSLPNPSAGIDGVQLPDGRFMLVYNPTTEGRRQLALAVSTDGVAWEQVHLLEDTEGEYSYPAMIVRSDGMVHVTYTWKRERIKHVVVDPSLF